MKQLLTLLALFFLVTACSQAPQSADPSVITSRSDTWETALNAQDVDTLVELYTSDSRLMPPNAEAMIGHDAVRSMFGGMIDAGLSGTLTTVEAKVFGDMGYRVGIYELQSGDEAVDTGKFMETWRRDNDGQWRIVNDIWNSNGAMQTDMPMTHLMIMHEVDDAEKWLAAWRGENSRHKLFAENGAAHVHTFRSANNPNLTGLVIAVTDMDALDTMLTSEEGMAAAAEDGVKRDTMKVLAEAK
ncbi:MAG: AtzH-like domain-containing protein [Woeseiaceae bacterium]